MSDTPTLDTFKAVLVSTVREYRRMGEQELLSTVRDIAADLDIEWDELVVDVLSRLARAGSIPAAAALVVFADGDIAAENRAFRIVADLGLRSEDIKAELAMSELTRQLEEAADEMVKRGEMTVRIDPETGRKLYGRTKPKAAE